MFALPVLTLAGLLSLAPAPSLEEVEAVPARVRVVAGRVSLAVGEAEPERVSRSSEPRMVEGEASLEVGAGARVEVRWNRVMSLHVLGPAELSWEPVEGSLAPELKIASARRLEWEVRAGAPTAELAQGWTLAAGRGALWMADAPDGGMDVGHHGGQELRVRTLVRRTPGTWPSRLTAGQRVRLCAPPEDAP